MSRPPRLPFACRRVVAGSRRLSDGQKLVWLELHALDRDERGAWIGAVGLSERLGMPVKMRIGSEQIVFRCGDLSLALMLKLDLQTPVEPGAIESPLGRAHFAVNVSAADWSAALEELQAAGVPLSQPVDWGDHDCFYLTDPDGNLIELMSWRV